MFVQRRGRYVSTGEGDVCMRWCVGEGSPGSVVCWER